MTSGGPFGEWLLAVLRQLAESSYSIDTFLETRQQFLDLGKTAIADVLLRAEWNARSTNTDPKVDWYRYLLNTILLQQDAAYFSEQAKNLRVVTFNFDRSLEHALFEGVRHLFGTNEADSNGLVKELRIHHVHGRLGNREYRRHECVRQTSVQTE